MRTIILLLLFISGAAYSCDYALGQNLRPFMESPLFNPAKEPKKPAVIVKIERAKSFVASCRQQSFLEIEIQNSAENHSAGYIFKFKTAPISGLLFAEEPVVSNGINYFYFSWLESEAELKRPIETTIEIIAVLPNGKKSEPIYVRLSSPSNHH